MNQSIHFLINYTSTCLVVFLFYWSNSCCYCFSVAWATRFRDFHPCNAMVNIIFIDDVQNSSQPKVKIIHPQIYITPAQKGWFITVSNCLANCQSKFKLYALENSMLLLKVFLLLLRIVESNRASFFKGAGEVWRTQRLGKLVLMLFLFCS